MSKRKLFIGLGLLLAAIGAVIAYYSFSADRTETAEIIEKLEVLDVKDERLVMGDSSNPLPIVEYADVLCPYCAIAHKDILPRINEEYIETSKAYYEIRLVGVIRPESARAAEGAYCAAEQDKFWDYIDLAYKETWEKFYSKNLSPEDVTIFHEGELEKFVQRAGVDLYPWNLCMDEGDYAETIETNRETMVSLKGYGTPFFLFNDVPYGSGTPEYAVFKSALDAEYRRATAE